MITKARLGFFILGAVLATLLLAVPRIIVASIVIAAIAFMVEPRYTFEENSAKENRLDQLAILIGAAVVLISALLAHAF